jgi:phage/plasmid-associated DNA primase
MILACNHLPEVPSNDNGTWRRIRVVNFISTFGDVEDPEKFKFKADITLKERLPKLRSAFLWILVEYYKWYMNGDEKRGIPSGLNEPQEVLQCTKSYRETNDVYAEFITETIDESKNPNDKLRIDQLYSVFKVWYKDIYSGAKCPRKQMLKDYFVKRFGNYSSKCWRGITLRTEDDDSDSDLDDDYENVEAAAEEEEAEKAGHND